MACCDSAQHPTPICDGPAILIYMQRPGDSIPTPVWVTATCVDGAITAFNYFSDAAGTVPITGFTIGDRIPTPPDTRGLSCEGSLATDLCPATIAALNQIIVDQTTAINANIDAAEAAIVAAINPPADPNYSQVLTYTANGDVETITRTTAVAGFAPCEVQTYSYNGSFQLTGISAWVVCP